jgi:hypothetical protein
VGAVRSVRRRDRLFPRFDYYLDESDPDIVVLRRQDDSFVAAFSARGVKREGIVDASSAALSSRSRTSAWTYSK